MKFVRGLFEARPFWRLRPEQAMVIGENPAGPDHVRVARAVDGAFAVLYLPTGNPVAVRLNDISGDRIKAWWFNPRQNASQLIGRCRKRDRMSFVPPSSGRSNDWVLVIDDAARDLSRLGYRHQNFIPKVKEER
jgi:hypothetical protein